MQLYVHVRKTPDDLHNAQSVDEASSVFVRHLRSQYQGTRAHFDMQQQLSYASRVNPASHQIAAARLAHTVASAKMAEAVAMPFATILLDTMQTLCASVFDEKIIHDPRVVQLVWDLHHR